MNLRIVYLGWHNEKIRRQKTFSMYIIYCIKVQAVLPSCLLSVILDLGKRPLTDIGLAKFLVDHNKV
jgi:hypothetical protein